LEPQAERRIRRSYIFAELAKAENLEVTDADIDADISERMGLDDLGESTERLRSFFNSPEIRDTVSRQLFARKVLDFLTEMATEGAVKPSEERAQIAAEQKAEAEARAAARKQPEPVSAQAESGTS
jgi:trigger factor